MAHQEKLTSWILQNAELLDLRVQELSWIHSIFPGSFDLQVSIRLFEERFVGRGTDEKSNVALGKAVCEALERSICFRKGISSLGLAGHFLRSEAQFNARLEFLERRAISAQISQGFELEEIEFGPVKTLGRYENLGIKIRFFALPTMQGTAVSWCVADGRSCPNPFGGIMGLGAHPDDRLANRKALVECLRSLEFFLHASPRSIKHGDFAKIQSPIAADRHALLRDVEYFDNLISSFKHSPPKNIGDPEGSFEEVELLNQTSGCPLIFVRYVGQETFEEPEFLA